MFASCGPGRRGPMAPGPGVGTFSTVELSAPTIADRRKLASIIVVGVSWRCTDADQFFAYSVWKS